MFSPNSSCSPAALPSLLRSNRGGKSCLCSGYCRERERTVWGREEMRHGEKPGGGHWIVAAAPAAFLAAAASCTCQGRGWAGSGKWTSWRPYVAHWPVVGFVFFFCLLCSTYRFWSLTSDVKKKLLRAWRMCSRACSSLSTALPCAWVRSLHWSEPRPTDMKFHVVKVTLLDSVKYLLERSYQLQSPVHRHRLQSGLWEMSRWGVLSVLVFRQRVSFFQLRQFQWCYAKLHGCEETTGLAGFAGFTGFHAGMCLNSFLNWGLCFKGKPRINNI